MSEKKQLMCTACGEYYLADVVGLPDASTEESTIPHQCPVCDNKKAKIVK